MATDSDVSDFSDSGELETTKYTGPDEYEQSFNQIYQLIDNYDEDELAPFVKRSTDILKKYEDIPAAKQVIDDLKDALRAHLKGDAVKVDAALVKAANDRLPL